MFLNLPMKWNGSQRQKDVGRIFQKTLLIGQEASGFGVFPIKGFQTGKKIKPVFGNALTTIAGCAWK
jgi:hypothetical protein